MIWFNVKKRLPITESYNKYYHDTLHHLKFENNELIVSEGKYLGNNRFEFVNLEHQFSREIDWDFIGNGKLWNYNLQYFDFIFDKKSSKEDNIHFIESCSERILSNTLLLEAYPVSLRLVNWLLFFSQTGYQSETFEKAIKKQIAFLEKNLEIQLQANHYLENLISLYIAAVFLKNDALLQKPDERLKFQLSEQILDDGAHYERSPMYHIILLSKLLLLYRLLQSNELQSDFLNFLGSIISKMKSWLDAFCFQNGKYALFNDAAPGIAPDLKIIQQVFYKTGLKTKPINLSNSGFRKLTENHFEIVANVGNITPVYQPGHAHSDMLSFCLNYRGKETFIDPGVSTYEVNEQRLLERGTSFHNTVTINNENQSEIWASFRMARRAKLVLKKDEEKGCKAVHVGYKRKYGVTVSREFYLNENRLEITDEILGIKTPECVAHFYLAPEIKVIQTNSNNLIFDNGLRMSFENGNSLKLMSVQIPSGYNRFVTAQKVEVHFREKLVTRIAASS